MDGDRRGSFEIGLHHHDSSGFPAEARRSSQSPAGVPPMFLRREEHRRRDEDSPLRQLRGEPGDRPTVAV